MSYIMKMAKMLAGNRKMEVGQFVQQMQEPKLEYITGAKVSLKKLLKRQMGILITLYLAKKKVL